ncbi:MAG: hypothetical protein IKK82_08345 [Kiritimatiellae bacterium]|nr:hypothetical protein [Kiritimatiellia bacterium]
MKPPLHRISFGVSVATTRTVGRAASIAPQGGARRLAEPGLEGDCPRVPSADGKGPRYGYTQDGKLSQRIWARGIVTDYSYDGWGSLTNTVYSDATPAVTLFYDAMGRQTNAVDASGVTTFRYDDYGSLTNETVVGAAGENTIIRHWDAYGRTTGYSLVGRDDPIAPQRQTTIGYDAVTGRIATMLANGSNVPFTWSYLPGSDLKSSLAYPNGLTASWTYDDNGQLLQVRNAVVATAPSPSETEVISQYDYVYDNAGRRISCAKSGSSFTQNDALSYGYNEKSELTNAVAAVDSDYRYAYDFDEIGNRESANERGTNAAYMANQLNQYTAVDDFTPQFDDDGNQTLVKTATGIWTVAYNGENRPVLWTGGTTNIVMKYDRMGRRVEYLETVGGSPSSVTVTNAHHRFVYDGYLCVQRLNAAANNAVDLAFGWDPTEPVATRPLWMQRVSGSYNFFYFHDGNKNVSDLVSYQSARGVPAHYEYAPFGAMTAATTNTAFTAFNAASVNPYRFSSEYADDALGLVYYNYRHYNTADGRWMNYDRHNPFAGYVFVMNDGIGQTDYLGLESSSSALAPSQRGRDCIYRVYVADGISDPDLSLWTSYCSQKFPKYPNGDRYGYWGCGANVINEMTGNEHPGFELPVVLPKGKRANEDMQTDLGKRGMKPNYAEKFETISGSPNPFLVKTIERLKRFAKEDSGDMDCRCKSITIKIDCSNTLRNAEVFELLSDKERYKVYNEVERRKKYDKYSVFKIAYELYSAMYKEKLKCGTKTIVE